ncbi:catalase family peroxidase [Pseudomonas sp. DWP3-1-2]|uniref:catalase family peroxidase n=1 Tax=Pseudomonas sp. DWP3-1-2 TaxID=2804645 RepID=UPI003CE6DD45
MVERFPPPEQQKPPLGTGNTLFRLAGIGVLVVTAAVSLAYVGGYLDPHRLTPARLVDGLEHNNGVHPGFRRNHSKGVCVAGYFESNGNAAPFSSAEVFSPTRTPVEGRFALPTGNPYSPDSAVPLRSMALRFTQANGQQWRTGMNAMPVFPVSTPEAFYELMQAQAPDPATGKPDPAKPAAFFASHPESAAFLAWVKTAKPSASYATETYTSVNAFYLINAGGERQAVRWKMVPVDQPTVASPPPDAKDYLEPDLDGRLASGPLRWDLMITLAEPGDPVSDASKQWPGERRVVNAGTLVIDSTQPQVDGDCRDINFDPLVLPAGIAGSEDPLLAARSAAYAASYQRRTGEVDQLPKTTAPVSEKKS